MSTLCSNDYIGTSKYRDTYMSGYFYLCEDFVRHVHSPAPYSNPPNAILNPKNVVLNIEQIQEHTRTYSKHTRTHTHNCLFSSVFLDKSAKVLTFRNANCSNSSVLLRVSFQIHLLALTRCPLTAHLSARQEGVCQDKSAPLLTHLGDCWCLDNKPCLL